MKICLQCKGLLEINEWKCPNCGWKPDSQNGLVVFSPELSAGSGDYPTTAFQILAELEGNHSWFKSRSSLLIFALSHYVCRSETICDVGCGTDFDLSGIRCAIRLVGCDAATDGPFLPKKLTSDVTLFQMDARNIPFQEDFDVMGAFDLLVHFEDDEQVISELFRTVKSEVDS
jgi:SAM-dependent methyltransferase